MPDTNTIGRLLREHAAIVEMLKEEKVVSERAPLLNLLQEIDGEIRAVLRTVSKASAEGQSN
jgi:hypothetical protein